MDARSVSRLTRAPDSRRISLAESLSFLEESDTSAARSEIDRDPFLFPIAVAHRLRPVAAAQFGRQIPFLVPFAPLFGFGQRALCGRWSRSWAVIGSGLGLARRRIGARFRHGLGVMRVGRGVGFGPASGRHLFLLRLRPLDIRRHLCAQTTASDPSKKAIRMSDTGVQARRSAVYLSGSDSWARASLMSELLALGRSTSCPLMIAPARNVWRWTRCAGWNAPTGCCKNTSTKYPPLTVRNALRVGTVELCQGGAAHGVVNAMVDLVASHKKLSHLKGLTNAVLRKIAAEGPDAWDALRAPRLPKWLRGPLVEAWGAEAMAAMEAAHFAGAPLDLTAKSDPAGRGRGCWRRRSCRQDRCACTDARTGHPRCRDLPKGDWWVQDAAAALPVEYWTPKTGEAVLDLVRRTRAARPCNWPRQGREVTAVDDNHATDAARVRKTWRAPG